MQAVDFFNLFLIISALFGFGFCIFLYFSKNGRDKSMVYLNLLILTISLNNFQSWVLAKNLFQHKYWLDYIQIPWHFLIAPFFYMFLTNYLEIARKSHKILKSILTAFIVATLLQVFFVIFYSDTSNHNSTLDILYEKYTSIEEVVSLVISISVFGYAYYVLAKKENLFPKILSYDNLRWVYTFFIIGIIGYILWIVALIVKINMNFTGFIFSYYPLRIYTTLLIFWLGYQSILHLNLLKERISLRTAITKKRLKENQNVVLDEVDNKYDDEFKKIHSYIINKKKYTEAKVTRELIAQELGMSKSKFSTIMNSVANKSFIDYMNELRVIQAKKLLTHSDYKQYTTHAVGLESGFNSKSTFYAVFKKYTGKTPAEFREINN